MHIEVIMDTQGSATAGVDHRALVENIQAELDKLATAARVPTPTAEASPPPDGAQGDWSALQWILDIAADPAMAKIYATGLIHALNQILNAARLGTQNKDAGQKDTTAQDDKPVVRVKIFGKQLALPVATAVIKKFLETLDDKND